MGNLTVRENAGNNQIPIRVGFLIFVSPKALRHLDIPNPFFTSSCLIAPPQLSLFLPHFSPTAKDL